MENDTPDIPDNLGDLREQIQAAQAALSADVPDALPLAPTFYSRLQLAIMGLGGKPIASEAVKNRLKKSGKEGFSEEEWKWSGMDEFLGGRKTVTKDELLKHFEENQVELLEVLKQGIPEEIWGPNVQPGQGNPGGPKYAGYQTPGGSNYRELLLMLPQTDGTEGYQSSHWDEENILAHVRFNERTGPGGEKILHIEEVQSDFHQAGREQGYAEPNQNERLKEIRREMGLLDAQLESMFTPEHYKERIVAAYTDEQAKRAREKGNLTESESKALDELRPQYQDYRSQWIELNKEREGLENRVPDAPFKENWPELAMKRMLRYAAENDYDRITLNPGEQINKVLSSGAGALEGQKKFYDEVLPNIMAKLGKPFGASVSSMQIAGHSTEQINNMLDENSRLHAAAAEGSAEEQMYRERANDLFEQLMEAKKTDTGSPVVASSLPVTPAMTQSVLGKGMPMMAEGGDVPDRFGISYARENMGSFDDEREPMPVNEEDDLSELLAAIGDLDDATEKLIGAIERQEQEESRPHNQLPTSNAGGKPRFGKNLGGDGRLSVDMLAAYARARQ